MKNITNNNTMSPLSFEKGIAGVSFPKASDPVATITSGKSGSVSSPASTTIGNISQEKLYASTLDIKMQQFLTPTITVQAILQPVIYNNALRSTKKKLLASLAQNEELTAVQALVAILHEDEELKNLLQMYRNLLYKG